MKIAIVTDTFPPDVNGVAMTLHRLAGGLLERGHRVDLFRPRPERPADTAIAAGDYREHAVASIPLPGYPELRLGLPATRRLRALWRDDCPEAIYVATESPLGLSAIKAAASLDIPVVSGFHTNFHSYTRDYNVPILERATTTYLRKLHNRAFCTLAPSRDTADDLARRGFERVRVLGRGVDMTLFSPGKRDPSLRAQWGASDSTPVAIFVGRLASEKNLALASKVFESLRRIDPATACVFVGDGPQRALLESDHPGFIYAGMQRGEDLARHYASADLFIFPSLTETFGNVLLEALSSGLVTVSFDYACARAHIENESNGFTAPFGDEAAFLESSAAALRYWNAPSIRERARQTALRLSWDTVVGSFEGYLRDSATASTLSRSSHSSPKPGAHRKQILRFKTVFVSDIHLGTPDCKITQLAHFLRNVRCEKLVLNGDIIDAWSLKRGGRWTKSHTYFVRLILKKMEKENTEVVYLRGNHDDIVTRFLPLKLDNLTMATEHVHESPHGRYLVVHGDGFDVVTTNQRWLAILGAIGYTFLLRLNRVCNRYRSLRGKPGFSLSKSVKARVKSAINFIGNYEEQLRRFAERRGCTGIICGHIHTPADKRIGDIHYLNSGDWVESLSAVVENLDRRFEVITYADFCERSNRRAKGHNLRGVADPIPEVPEEAAPGAITAA